MSRPPLASRRFAPLFWCQFFSAFNDNFLKNALALLILFKDRRSERRSAGDTGRWGIFIAPFFLLSAFGGDLADPAAILFTSGSEGTPKGVVL